MAGTAATLESLLSSVDHIYEDFRSGLMEIQVLKSNAAAEIKKREALQMALQSLHQEKERVTKLYAESLHSVVEQVEHRTTCASLKEQVTRLKEEWVNKEVEQCRAMESMKQEHAKRTADLEARIRGLLVKKASLEATVNELRQDLEAHKAHIQHLATTLNRVHLNVHSRYEVEIQELKTRLGTEQEEKNLLNNKLQMLDKELLFCRSKLLLRGSD